MTTKIERDIAAEIAAAEKKKAEYAAEDAAKIEKYEADGGCENCCAALPGINFPIAPDWNTDRAWVERCSTCDTFDGDLSAALYVGRLLGLRVKTDPDNHGYNGHPYIEGISFSKAEKIMAAIRKTRSSVQTRFELRARKVKP